MQEFALIAERMAILQGVPIAAGCILAEDGGWSYVNDGRRTLGRLVQQAADAPTHAGP